ncbi:hypothetical protein [Nocardia cyriacigeorgica]|uniref:hypothetical protein n=1 Tax=Nocardia cyriacigeorgica TaxID=135487 RepID=UPI002456CA04|nr:hypothetical protein [Nocardia cyriacigeorgica]
MPHITTLRTWTPASWSPGDQREVFVNGHVAGNHIGVVQINGDGDIAAAVSVILVPEHADEEVATAKGFQTFADARDWAEHTIELLNA